MQLNRKLAGDDAERTLPTSKTRIARMHTALLPFLQNNCNLSVSAAPPPLLGRHCHCSDSARVALSLSLSPLACAISADSLLMLSIYFLLA